MATLPGGLRLRILLAFASVILAGFMAYQVGHVMHDRADAQLEAQARTHPDLEEAVRDAGLAERNAERLGKALVAAALAFAGVVGVFLYRSIAKPLKELEAGTRRIAAGDLSARVAVRRRDELGRLGEHFNEMAVELELHQQRLLEAEKLASLGRIAAGIAHEMNNPLTVIVGYAKLLADSGDARTADDAKLVLEEAERCRTIVAGLLDLSRTPRLARAAVDLADLCRDVAERLADAGHECRVDVVAEGEATAWVDAGKVRQVIWNLLSNACQAAPASTIDVHIAPHGESICVSVRDRGPGLSRAISERLFEPFATDKAGGTGLGLAISAAIARAHGGAIRASNAAGGGATFDLLLPRGNEAAA